MIDLEKLFDAFWKAYEFDTDLTFANFIDSTFLQKKNIELSELEDLLESIDKRIKNIRNQISEDWGLEVVKESNIIDFDHTDEYNEGRFELEVEKFQLIGAQKLITDEVRRKRNKLNDKVLHSLSDSKRAIEYSNLKNYKDFPKIRWCGSEAQFVYLFEQLVKAKLLPEDFRDTTGGGYSLMAKCFENKQGKPFKNTQLAITSQNITHNKKTPGKPKGAEKIDKMISKTKRKK